MTEVTVREAAEQLGVHQSRVRALLSAGTLHGRRVGSQWLISVDDVDLRKALIGGGAKSRAMSARTAWAAAALADGGQATWITASERSRLRSRLLRHGSDSALATYQRWLMSRQASITCYRLADVDLAELLRTEGVVATGLTAARAYELGLGTSGQADIYATADLARRLVKDFFLIASDQGNLTVRVVDGTWHLDTARLVNGQLVTPRLITAVDLLDQHDARSTATGRDLLATTLSDFTRSLASSKPAATDPDLKASRGV
jgi:excisionase family DNA binding protein